MGCTLSIPSGGKSYKDAKSDTHDISIERYSRSANPHHTYRDPSAEQAYGPQAAEKGEKPPLVLIIRRKDAVDTQHEADELGSAYNLEATQ
jgi:hypothetical protein